VPAAREAGALL